MRYSTRALPTSAPRRCTRTATLEPPFAAWKLLVPARRTRRACCSARKAMTTLEPYWVIIMACAQREQLRGTRTDGAGRTRTLSKPLHVPR